MASLLHDMEQHYRGRRDIADRMLQVIGWAKQALDPKCDWNVSRVGNPVIRLFNAFSELGGFDEVHVTCLHTLRKGVVKVFAYNGVVSYASQATEIVHEHRIRPSASNVTYTLKEKQEGRLSASDDEQWLDYRTVIKALPRLYEKVLESNAEVLDVTWEPD